MPREGLSAPNAELGEIQAEKIGFGKPRAEPVPIVPADAPRNSVARRVGNAPSDALRAAGALRHLLGYWSGLVALESPPGGGGDVERVQVAHDWLDAAATILHDAADLARCALDVLCCPNVAPLERCHLCDGAGEVADPDDDGFERSPTRLVCSYCGGAGRVPALVGVRVSGAFVESWQVIELRGHVARLRIDRDGYETEMWVDLESRGPLLLDGLGGGSTRRQAIIGVTFEVVEEDTARLLARSARSSWVVAVGRVIAEVDAKGGAS